MRNTSSEPYFIIDHLYIYNHNCNILVIIMLSIILKYDEYLRLNICRNIHNINALRI